MKFFNNCNTIEEVKKLYKELAKQNHPDKGGNLETMQHINNEYSIACKTILKGDTINNYSDQDIDEMILNLEKYKEALNAVIHLQGIKIELVGSWIWLTGNTYTYRKAIKEAGYFFASKKEAWYFRTDEFKSHNRQKMSLEQIRNKYGSKAIKTEDKNSYSLA